MIRFSPFKTVLVAMAAAAFFTASASAQLANVKVVTDASPDYSDMESLVRSITSNWKTDADKMYALFYWAHIARRQTQPMQLHGFELTDPIRQFNDYGFTMCSTISGNKCSIWNYMGYPCRYFDISLHTVPDVWYEGAFHHYDNSLSMMYTMPDGKTIASIEDIGKTMAGPETDGKPVKGYIALYHALTGTSPNGYCEGADDARPLSQIVHDFTPKYLKYRYYLYDQDRGHRYILNLRDGEVYSRYYSRQDANSPDAIEFGGQGEAYKADPAYYVPNGQTEDGKPKDPESVNVRYHIRGNGIRTWTPLLDDAHLAGELYSSLNLKAGDLGLQPATPNQPAEAVFKVEGANVITGLKIHAVAPAAVISVSVNNGLTWTDVWKSDKPGNNTADLKLVNEVNGSYEVLVKLNLSAPAAHIKSISFETITQINSKTQPQLTLGANTVYVGNGDQSESIVFWPELRNDAYKTYACECKNVACAYEENAKGPEDKIKFLGYTGGLFVDKGGEEGHVVFKIDAPTDLTSMTYGGRLYNRSQGSSIEFLHSFDGGKTWNKDYSLSDTKAPWDVIHYVTINDIPAGTKSVLFKYSLNTPDDHSQTACSIYAVRMEVDHKLAAPSSGPLEITFNWRERQKDYTTVKRSHTQLVEKLPFTYKIDVGGFDQPIVDSLVVNLKGARGDVQYGYSDGKDVGGEKWVGNWVTYGKNLALGKPYTCSLPSVSQWGSGDKTGKRLTDGSVGSCYTGGTNMAGSPMWNAKSNPEIVVDLGEPQKCAAFRIHTNGYPWWDALKGEIKDKCEVLTSLDGQNYTSQGFVDFNLHWKDLPVNFMYPDDEMLCAYNFMLPMAQPVEARYVKYKLAAARSMEVTQVQVLDGYKTEPFDLKIALPNPADNGKAPPKPDVSPNAKQWPEGSLPTTIGKPLKVAGGE